MSDSHYVIGIDGGGSNLRLAVVSNDLTIAGQHQLSVTVNPNVVGRPLAASALQQGLRAVLHTVDLPVSAIAGVGIGIAGALSGDLSAWLQQTITEVIPGTQVVTGGDVEAALVGAHGTRCGVLLIAGTGSVAYGINAAGETALVSGWGYLLGDEGGGYWLGLQGLQAAVREVDGRGPKTSLTTALLKDYGLPDRSRLIEWLYRTEARTREIAALAPVILDHAAAGDTVARQLVELAARELVLAIRSVYQRLGMENLSVAFAGGLLETRNPLSNLLCELLGLTAIPLPRYPPVIGAAILALIELGQYRSKAC
jgi:N-acetylglucosamine kinase-like BadF-type ATPase